MKKILFILLLSSGLCYGEQKSAIKAMFLSAVLPGLGEQYLGDTKGAIRGYLAEGAIWTTYFTAHWYTGTIAHNYGLYSIMNAGAASSQMVATNKLKTYYDAIEWFQNIDAYNTMISEQARDNYPDTSAVARAQQLEYIKENTFSDSLSWSWTDLGKWDVFRGLRKSERSIINKAGYCVGIALANRLVSVLLVAYKAPKNYGIDIYKNGIELNYMFK